jgi:hypothetical protein
MKLVLNSTVLRNNPYSLSYVTLRHYRRDETIECRTAEFVLLLGERNNTVLLQDTCEKTCGHGKAQTVLHKNKWKL